MTREEAIRRLGGILTEAVEFENSVCYVTEEDREPLEMAIKALRQELCDDCISRQVAIDVFKNAIGDKYPFICEPILATLSLIPSVIPKPKTGHCGACMKDCRTLDEFIEDSKESEEINADSN